MVSANNPLNGWQEYLALSAHYYQREQVIWGNESVSARSISSDFWSTKLKPCFNLESITVGRVISKQQNDGAML